MLFNYGIGNKCTFNASLYFSKSGLVVVLDNQDNSIKFLTIDSFNDLLLFIPDGSDTMSNFVESYVSYFLMSTDGFSIIHCTKISTIENIAKIVECKRTLNEQPIEVEREVMISDYREMLQEKLKEVYNATCR